MTISIDGEGRFVTVGAGDSTVVLANGLPRLVGPSDWDCFPSVKGVDRIELTREPAEATAETIALARLAH